MVINDVGKLHSMKRKLTRPGIRLLRVSISKRSSLCDERKRKCMSKMEFVMQGRWKTASKLQM